MTLLPSSFHGNFGSSKRGGWGGRRDVVFHHNKLQESFLENAQIEVGCCFEDPSPLSSS